MEAWIHVCLCTCLVAERLVLLQPQTALQKSSTHTCARARTRSCAQPHARACTHTHATGLRPRAVSAAREHSVRRRQPFSQCLCSAARGGILSGCEETPEIASDNFYLPDYLSVYVHTSMHMGKRAAVQTCMQTHPPQRVRPFTHPYSGSARC